MEVILSGSPDLDTKGSERRPPVCRGVFLEVRGAMDPLHMNERFSGGAPGHHPLAGESEIQYDVTGSSTSLSRLASKILTFCSLTRSRRSTCAFGLSLRQTPLHPSPAGSRLRFISQYPSNSYFPRIVPSGSRGTSEHVSTSELRCRNMQRLGGRQAVSGVR